MFLIRYFANLRSGIVFPDDFKLPRLFAVEFWFKVLCVESDLWNCGCGVVDVGLWMWNCGFGTMDVELWILNYGCGFRCVRVHV